MTLGADVKALIDPTAITQTYRTGYVPDDAAFPYASFLDPVSDSPILTGDAQTLARRRLIQVDLWQTETDEDVNLPDVVVQALDGADVTSGFRLRVQDVNVIAEDDDIIHHALTVSVARLS